MSQVTQPIPEGPKMPTQKQPSQLEGPAKNREVTILCPICGLRFAPSNGNICNTCLMKSTDIADQIQKEGVLTFCRYCHRWERPPWMFCERQSKELLSICLSKIRGLNKLKLTNAAFIWTQPHCRRIKVKLSLTKQLDNGSEVSQTTIVEFVQQYLQCPDCKKQFTPHKWEAVVQVRQHVNHKKTFLHLQQAIIKNKAHQHVLKAQQQEDGVNFYFKSNMYALKMVEFLVGILPVRVKHAKQLISANQRDNTYNYTFTHSVQIPRICKDDIVLIPPKLSKMLGGCGLMLLCYKVTTYFHLIDLSNYRTIQLYKQQYDQFQHKLDILPFNKFKTTFEVLNSEPLVGKTNLNESVSNLLDNRLYQTVITRTTQWEQVYVKCHLGELQAGQIVQGYDLRFLAYNDSMDNYPGVPEVILVRRAKNPQKKKARKRKIRRLEDQGIAVQGDEKKKKKGKTAEVEEFEEFLDQLDDQQEGQELQEILEKVEQQEVTEGEPQTIIQIEVKPAPQS